MGFLFGKKKAEDNSSISKEILAFLKEADERYMRAFETRSLSHLKEHFTRECCIVLSRRIVAEAPLRYFSTDKFRKTEWTLVNRTPDGMVVKKDVDYDKISVGASFKMKVSTDYCEHWTLVISSANILVSKIETINE